MKIRRRSPGWPARLRGAFFAMSFVVINGAATMPLFGQSPLRAHTRPANAIRPTSSAQY